MTLSPISVVLLVAGASLCGPSIVVGVTLFALALALEIFLVSGK